MHFKNFKYTLSTFKKNHRQVLCIFKKCNAGSPELVCPPCQLGSGSTVADLHLEEDCWYPDSQPHPAA